MEKLHVTRLNAERLFDSMKPLAQKKMLKDWKKDYGVNNREELIDLVIKNQKEN